MRFPADVRDAKEIGLPEPAAAPKEMVRDFAQAIESLESKKLDLSELGDRDTDRLLAVADRKRAKGQDVVEVETPPAADENDDGKVIDLMEVLKRRLRSSGGTETTSTKGPNGKAETKSVKKESSRNTDRPTAKSTNGAGGKLADLSKKELYEKAKKLGIEGRSAMDRAQLVKAIQRSA
jgi:DNA end-binding protein Ku